MFVKVKPTFGTRSNIAEINKYHIWLTIAAVYYRKMYSDCLYITVG